MGYSQLVIKERIVLDRQLLDEMCRALGPEQGERVIGGAVEELAVWISRIPQLFRRGDLDEVARLTCRMGPLAARLGMPLLARVAGDLQSLCSGHDRAALGAVLARAIRVGESSLVAVWELQDMRV